MKRHAIRDKDEEKERPEERPEDRGTTHREDVVQEERRQVTSGENKDTKQRGRTI